MAKFQSAPRSRDRGDRKPATLARAIVVSIRAPVMRPGRQNPSRRRRPPSMFQSAPRSRDRGDPLSAETQKLTGCFNPRPGHATGATTAAISRRRHWQVSIRAPVTRPGRQNNTMKKLKLITFQSAPRSRDRGDGARVRVQVARSSFNPRPGHATGATIPPLRKRTLRQ